MENTTYPDNYHLSEYANYYAPSSLLSDLVLSESPYLYETNLCGSNEARFYFNIETAVLLDYFFACRAELYTRTIDLKCYEVLDEAPCEKRNVDIIMTTDYGSLRINKPIRKRNYRKRIGTRGTRIMSK
jgi:hypothetical protein